MIKVFFYRIDNTIEQVGVVAVLYICIWEVSSSVPEEHPLPWLTTSSPLYHNEATTTSLQMLSNSLVISHPNIDAIESEILTVIK
jgi:hypothetical protein